MSEIKFTGEEDDLLVKLVLENPLLFDPEVESYKHSKSREKTWKIIGGKLNKSGADCKKRWKYIRDSYNRFKRKRRLGTGSAVPTKNSKWEFFQRLQFLDLVSTERSTTSNIDQGAPVPVPAPVPSPSASSTSTQFETESEIIEECPKETSQSPKPPLLRRKIRCDKNIQDASLDCLVKRDESRQLTMHQLSAITTESEDDVASFGNHVKAVLRKLQPRLRIQAKNDIFNILSKYELKQMDMQEEGSLTRGTLNPSTTETSSIPQDVLTRSPSHPT
ncbi:uncharacterized protein [Anabrus simplex]|uniref:uncharacterized protein n=1 Tax=Anabrus simplex TaxID=316456 RepID=UPI0035A2A119